MIKLITTCKHCGKYYNDFDNYCSNCGRYLKKDVKITVTDRTISIKEEDDHE